PASPRAGSPPVPPKLGGRPAPLSPIKVLAPPRPPLLIGYPPLVVRPALASGARPAPPGVPPEVVVEAPAAPPFSSTSSLPPQASGTRKLSKMSERAGRPRIFLTLSARAPVHRGHVQRTRERSPRAMKSACARNYIAPR